MASSLRLHGPALCSIVRDALRRRAAEFGLRPERIDALYVLNWGGFVNHSFTVSDGERAYHLKLATDADCEAALRRWHALHDLLEARYHAPEMIAWIDLHEASAAGPLFVHLVGAPPSDAELRPLLPDLFALLARLHADTDLAARLGPAPGALTCARCFEDTFIDRFDEDLKIVAEALPLFVAPETLSWMHAETRRLEAIVRAAPAFAAPAAAPVHGDLWPQNLLLTPSGDWYVLDWDDLALGDPALDYSLLLWSLTAWGAGPSWREFGLPVPSPAFAARMDLYARASLLDMVIDVLADWVEAAAAPEHLEEVRAVKERQHRQALATYRRLYG